VSSKSKMPEHDYLYAFTWATCPKQTIGPGVDGRFKVELVRQGQLAAVTSRIGLDRFDVERFQGRTAEDVQWLGPIAVRHNQIVRAVAECAPVIPLRLGTLFSGRSSLLTRMSQCAGRVTDSLQDLGDRQEWAVKIFVDSKATENRSKDQAPPAPHFSLETIAGSPCPVSRRGERLGKYNLQSRIHREVLEVEIALEKHADRCCRVRAFPARLTGRRGKVVWNAAYLLSRSAVEQWFAAVKRLRETTRRKGLHLEVTGPWPPYHFCPMPEM